MNKKGNKKTNNGKKSIKDIHTDIKKEEGEAREIYGTVNYSQIKIDQPRSQKDFFVKSLSKVAIATACTYTAIKLKETYDRSCIDTNDYLRRKNAQGKLDYGDHYDTDEKHESDFNDFLDNVIKKIG